jgi:hypothetical protein
MSCAIIPKPAGIRYIAAMTTDDKTSELDELRACRGLVRFIASETPDLSIEKAAWQRDDWKKRCMALLEKYRRAEALARMEGRHWKAPADRFDRDESNER